VFVSPTASTARVIGANLIDSMSVIGGVVAGTVAGRFAHARTTGRHGPTSRLAAGVAAGLTVAAITDSLLGTATSSWRGTLNRTAPEAPAATWDQARPRIAAQAATNAAQNSKYGWYSADPRNPAQDGSSWRGYEDGTAICYLAPGLYLRYQPDHHELGTTRSVGWTQQYMLETGDGTTVSSGPAPLLQLLDSLHTMPWPADKRAEQLARIVDDALAEQPDDDRNCPHVTGEVIQRRAAAHDIVDVTHNEAVDLINERLYHRRTRIACTNVPDGDRDQTAVVNAEPSAAPIRHGLGTLR
jgi:hypothetical protein